MSQVPRAGVVTNNSGETEGVAASSIGADVSVSGAAMMVGPVDSQAIPSVAKHRQLNHIRDRWDMLCLLSYCVQYVGVFSPLRHYFDDFSTSPAFGLSYLRSLGNDYRKYSTNCSR